MNLPTSHLFSWVSHWSTWDFAAIGAAATVLSAAVIGWQSFETRRSAAKAGQSVLISQELLYESKRERIDARFPDILCETDGRGFRDEIVGGERKSVAYRREFSVKADGHRVFRVGVDVKLTNNGPDPVQIHFSVPVFQSEDRFLSEYKLVGGGYFAFTYFITRTVREWIELAEARENGDTSNTHIQTVSYGGPGDADADESVEVVCSGSLLERVTGSTEDWRVSQEDKLNVVVGPSIRTYWLSRTRKLKIPESSLIISTS